MQTKLLKKLHKARTLLDTTPISIKLYLTGIFLFLSTFIISPFHYVHKADVLTIISLIIFSSGVIFESTWILDKLWKTKIGKTVVSIIFAAGSTITVAFSSTMVANITGTDPSKLPYTIALIGISFLPLYVWLGLICISILYMVVIIIITPFIVIFWLPFDNPKLRYILRLKLAPKKNYKFWLAIGIKYVMRLTAAGVLMSVLQILGNYGKFYPDLVNKAATQFLFNYEMYAKSHCTNKDIHEKVAYINTKEILVAKKTAEGNYEFKTKMCHL